MNTLHTIKQKAKAIEPIVRIGKNGITDNQVNEVKKVLKTKKLVKIKLLKSFVKGKDRKKIAKELAEKSGGKLIDCVGHVVVLWKR